MALKDFFSPVSQDQCNATLEGIRQNEEVPFEIMNQAWLFALQAAPIFRVGLLAVPGLMFFFLLMHATGVSDMGFSGSPLFTLILSALAFSPLAVAIDLNDPLSLTEDKKRHLALLLISRGNIRKRYYELAQEHLKAQQEEAQKLERAAQANNQSPTKENQAS